MKRVKRLAAALAAAALLASITPAAVFATGAESAAPSGSAAASSTVTEATPTPTVEPTAEPTATPTPTPTPTVKPTATPAPMKLTSCNIGTITEEGFAATTSVQPNQSGLTLRVYYSGDKAANKASVKGDSFINQNAATDFNETARYVDIVGLKYTGKGNTVIVTVGSVSATFTLTECEPIVAATPTPTPEPIATPEPDPQAASLIIKSSSIGTESVNAGEEFTLKLTIYATTSGNRNAEDVVVSVAPGEGVTVASGSSSTYIGAMAPGASQTVSFPMKALDSFTGGISTIAVSVTGSGAGSTTNVSVPVVQPDRFEISRIECPEILTAGEEDVCSVVFVNKGRNPVNNLTVSLAGTNMATTSQSEYVGNLAGGTESSVDFDISGVEAGELKATITVQYEGSDGEVVNLTQEVSCVIEEAYVDTWVDPGFVEDPGMYEEPEPAGLPLWAKILIGVAVVTVVVAAVVIAKKRKARKAALEADDEDI